MKSLHVGRMVRVLAAISLALPFIPPAPVAAAVDPCGDIMVIYARGAGFGLFGDDYAGFVTNPNALVPRLGTEASVHTHQLGQDGGFGGHTYTPSGDFSVLLQGIFPFLPGSAYDNSVIEGQSELVGYLVDRAATCPNEKYVLGGWSEGAQVIGQSLALLPVEDRDRIAFVALFGDPKLQTGNFRGPFGLVSFPAACTPLGAPPWKRWPDCGLMGGYFGPRDPYVPNDMRLRVGSWCAFLDAACDGDTGHLPFAMLPPIDAHFSYYLPDHEMARAAREAADALKLFVPAHAASFDASWFEFIGGSTGADLAVIFDTTGSMWGAIDDAKAQATDLAQRWLSFFPSGRVALVDYRDIDQGDPYAARIDLGLTSNITDFQTAVNGLSASGGGDYPEAQLSGVMTALDGLDWQIGATKAEIVITDAPGKDPEPISGFTRDQVAQHARSIDPVATYGVNVSGGQDVTDFLTPLTSGTGGQVFVLQSGQSLADALFAVLDTVHFSPVATLNGPYLAEAGTAIRFDTYGSFDADGSLVSYEWDFNNDGTVDQTTTTPFVDYTYPGEFHGVAAVRVVSSDGGSSLATADVSVITSTELANLAPVAPTSASASITGANQVTVTWVPASNDRADGYRVFLSDGSPVGQAVAGSPASVVVSGLDLSQPVVFEVVASNSYGNSAAVPAGLSSGTTISSLGDAHGWLGLRTADDQGTQFDLRVELLKNGNPVASGIKRCITGVTRNSQSAREAVVPWDAFSAVPVAAGDVLALRFSARIGTKPDNTNCSGPGGSHNSAVGLRLYYDAASRNSRFAATIGTSPSANLYLHSDGGACDKPVATNESQGVTNRQLSSIVPGTAPAKCKDSSVVTFTSGNTWSTLSTWSLAPLP